MRAQRFPGVHLRNYVLVFDEGDEALQGLLEFAKQEELTAARFTAIGAFREATLSWFNLETKDYEPLPIKEQVEVLSLVGNVAVFENMPKVHCHAVVGRRDSTTRGGHLLKGIVRPTLEVMIEEVPSHLQRRTDSSTGLPLIDADAKPLPHRRGRGLALETE